MASLIDWDSIPVPGLDRMKRDRGDERLPEWPWRMVVSGPTGCGKTRLVLDMVTAMLNIDKLIVIAKNVQEEIYQKLEIVCKLMAKIRDECIQEIEEYNDKVMERCGRDSELKVIPSPFTYYFSDQISDMPTMEGMLATDYNNIQTLLIIDDMVTVNNQDLIKNFIIACRKVNCSLIYITQSYYDVPILIRRQMSCAIIFGPVNKQSATTLHNAFGAPYSINEFVAIIQGATDKKHSFLYIDETAPIEKRFRRGFDDTLSSVYPIP